MNNRSTRLWALRPEQSLIVEAMDRRQRDDAGAPVSTGPGVPLDGSYFATVVDGVAIIPVYGLLLRRMNFFFWSYEEISRDLHLAQADPGVRSIVLDIDSPGGLASGCGDCAALIRASGPKPVEAFVGGMAASAAYYLASASRRITVGSATMLGSIGTVIEYVDLEPMFEKMGARIIRVVADQSPNKRLDPESAEGQAEMKALVNASAAEFVADVAKGRGISEEAVMANYGQGLVFDGMEAIRRGMADARGTLDDMIAEMAGRDQNLDAAPAAAAKEETPMEWASITAAALREHRADLVTAIEDGAKASSKAEADTKIASAVEAERSRILAIDEIATEGHEDLVAAAKADGKTTAAELALQIVKADKAAGRSYLAALETADAGAAAPQVKPTTATTVNNGSVKDRCKAMWDKDAELRAEFGDDFDAYLAFEKAAATGTAKILAS